MDAGGVGFFSSSTKMKRKEVDQVSDDFSDFSLSSPPPKIRRLCGELPPIMEEEETAEITQHRPEEAAMVEEEMGSCYGGNEERAIVVFKPVNPHLVASASNFSVSVDSHIISGFKNKFPWIQSDHMKLAEEEASMSKDGKDSLAVIPWIPSQFPILPDTSVPPVEAPELMEAEEMGEADMEIEADDGSSSSTEKVGSAVEEFRGGDGLPQWQQQHCMMLPQLPQNSSTPITWLQ